MYNKLFSKIVDSSIWLEPTPTRLIWVMFIAVMDEDGFVAITSVANVAHKARVTEKEAREAMKILESPDPNSAPDEHEGRRVERVPGGWMVLSSQKYRNMVTAAMVREQTRIRVARKREKDRKSNANVTPVTQRNGLVTPSRAIAKAKEEGANGSRPTVDDWLKSLESDKTYAGINVRQEYGKMLNWCKVHGKQPTQRRFVNWLNRTERPLPTNHAAKSTYKRNYPPPPREPTEAELQKTREIAKREADAFRESFGKRI